jgi:hypothetical protein
MYDIETRISKLGAHGGVAEQILKQDRGHQVPADGLHVCVCPCLGRVESDYVCARAHVGKCLHALMHCNRFHAFILS